MSYPYPLFQVNLFFYYTILSYFLSILNLTLDRNLVYFKLVLMLTLSVYISITPTKMNIDNLYTYSNPTEYLLYQSLSFAIRSKLLL